MSALLLPPKDTAVSRLSRSPTSGTACVSKRLARDHPQLGDCCYSLLHCSPKTPETLFISVKLFLRESLVGAGTPREWSNHTPQLVFVLLRLLPAYNATHRVRFPRASSFGAKSAITRHGRTQNCRPRNSGVRHRLIAMRNLSPCPSPGRRRWAPWLPRGAVLARCVQFASDSSAWRTTGTRKTTEVPGNQMVKSAWFGARRDAFQAPEPSEGGRSTVS